MTLRVYNTLTRSKEEFQTVEPDQVGMYLCGPTVYKASHIGHMVGPVIFDTIKRYLTYCGYNVTFVINITDIDDKLINRANENGTSVEELAREMTQDYFDNLELMGVKNTVDHFPLATEHITEMLDMIAQLVDDGYAYPLDGDVYFEVQKDDGYGKLSGRNIDETLAGTRIEASERKRNPADFALWKKSKPNEPSWDSKWGPGRPGWHIECSAMSKKLLGETFDIHGGGLDLVFPHHENELAQSECCSGKPFARYWMHNGLMQAPESGAKLGGQHDRHGDSTENQETNKLAGSKGAAPVKELFELFPPETIRFFLLSTHYRSPILLSNDRIEETSKSLNGFYRLIEIFERTTDIDFYALEVSSNRHQSISLKDGPSEFLSELTHLRNRFLNDMDDDFNTGGAVGVLFELRKCINSFMSDKGLGETGNADTENLTALTTGMTLLKEVASILGVFGKRIETSNGSDDQFASELMELIIELRAALRQNKHFDMADKIRDGLSEINVTIEDRPDGTIWKRD
jgi:cysteinyl-tRNA synthetase